MLLSQSSQEQNQQQKQQQAHISRHQPCRSPAIFRHLLLTCFSRETIVVDAETDVPLRSFIDRCALTLRSCTTAEARVYMLAILVCVRVRVRMRACVCVGGHIYHKERDASWFLSI